MSASPWSDLATQRELPLGAPACATPAAGARQPEISLNSAEGALRGTPRERKGTTSRPIGLSTPSLLRLLDTCDAVRGEDAISAEQVGFMARLLVQTTLPHRDPGPVEVWVRRNGNFTLQITPGRTVASASARSRKLGVPYGTYPRLIVTFLTTEAVRTRSPEIYLGRSLGEFMRRLGLQADGRAIHRVKEQMLRLIFANIDWAYSSGNTDLGQGLRPIESRCTFWDTANPEQGAIFPSSLTLNLRLYKEIIEASIPLDMRVVRELARLRTTMGMDIYPWLTWRQHRLIHGSRGATTIPWDSLSGQFGADYGRLRDFKAAFAEALRIVLELYPQGSAVPTESGLLLTPAGSHVRYRAPSPRPGLSGARGLGAAQGAAGNR